MYVIESCLSVRLNDSDRATKRHRARLKNPPKEVDEYLATLEAQGLAQTVSILRQFAELI